MNRYDDWFESVTPEEYPERLPAEDDPDLVPNKYVHKPVSPTEFDAALAEANRLREIGRRFDARYHEMELFAATAINTACDTGEIPVLRMTQRQAS